MLPCAVCRASTLPVLAPDSVGKPDFDIVPVFDVVPNKDAGIAV